MAGVDTAARLRVLLLEQGEGLWGAQRVILRLAPLLEERGIDQILGSPAQGPLARTWQRTGRPHVDVPAPRTRSVRSRSERLSLLRAGAELVRTATSALRVAYWARRLHVDLVLANNHWSHLEGVAAAVIDRRPVVLHLHTKSRADLAGRLRAVAVARATRTVAVSEAVRQALPARVRDRVEVIRNGVDAAAYAPERADPSLRTELARGEDALIVLSLSRYERDKGLEDLIRAVAALPADVGRPRLVLAGGSREDASYAQWLERLGRELLGDAALFLGYREDTAALLLAADVAVLPSHDEALPLVALEAQAAGVPIVASTVGGIPEVVEHDVTGLLFPPGDVPRLAAELERVLRDTGLRARLRENAAAQVRRTGTLEAQADGLAAVLFAAAGRRSPSPADEGAHAAHDPRVA